MSIAGQDKDANLHYVNSSLFSSSKKVSFKAK